MTTKVLEKLRRDLVGTKFISKDDIISATGITTVRVWSAESVGSCESKPDRLNVYCDNDNIITKINMG